MFWVVLFLFYFCWQSLLFLFILIVYKCDCSPYCMSLIFDVQIIFTVDFFNLHRKCFIHLDHSRFLGNNIVQILRLNRISHFYWCLLKNKFKVEIFRKNYINAEKNTFNCLLIIYYTLATQLKLVSISSKEFLLRLIY